MPYTRPRAAHAYRGIPSAVTTTSARNQSVCQIRGKKKSAARERRTWSLVNALVPRGRAGDWNQALMDLGATICTARAPRCGVCPVKPACRYAPMKPAL